MPKFYVRLEPDGPPDEEGENFRIATLRNVSLMQSRSTSHSAR